VVVVFFSLFFESLATQTVQQNSGIRYDFHIRAVVDYGDCETVMLAPSGAFLLRQTGRQIGDHRDPDLHQHRIQIGHGIRFDLQILFDPMDRTVLYGRIFITKILRSFTR